MTQLENVNVLIGLTSEEAKKLQGIYGKNELIPQKKQHFLFKILQIIKEPMFLLLLAASVIYFLLGNPRDGAIMLIFVIGVISIDVIQEWKTDKTLNALKSLSAPRITVVRDGEEQQIASVDLVPGDIMKISEGVKIPADGVILKANDLCVDESSLTGESAGVWKTPVENNSSNSKNTDYWRKDYCYAGTLVTQGSSTVWVDKIGAETEYGKIGVNVADAPESPTPLQKQTANLVRLCAVIAAVLFVLVGVATYLNIADHAFPYRLIESILSGVTLAMAMIPEEFPVILTVFLSMGAWRLAKKKSLVRKLPSVETLGSVSVLCVDKTGTITMNQMTVSQTWPFHTDEHHLCRIMGMACESNAYDPMENAMISYCASIGILKEDLFSAEFLAEYPFTNQTKMMGHVWNVENRKVIAAKGSPECILSLCKLTEEERSTADNTIMEMSRKGLRVIAVAERKLQHQEAIPSSLQECTLQLCGVIGLEDPPRESVKENIEQCTRAGIRVVMITGDNGITASSIAKRIGMPNADKIITGKELDEMTDKELQQRVKNISIFSRVIPEHKMRIVRAFQQNGEVVAMTGDGVNDAPALKYSDIGIAMGKRGSEVSREASDLILLDDNFSTIVETIRNGRRIYDNIRKAIGYVFTIHIPIAFSALLAPFLHINPVALLLLPLHVVLLELIIDPTCSVVLERQPAEKDSMQKKPRNPNDKIVTTTLLFKSIIQGITIFTASFGTYYSILMQTSNILLARTMGIVIIIISNLLLVQVNSSNSEFAIQSIRKLIQDKVMWIVNLVTVGGIILILYTPLNVWLQLTPLSVNQLACAVAIACVAVLWYELVKLVKFKFCKDHP